MSGLNGLFDGNRAARLVQPGDSYKVSVSILGRHSPRKCHSTRTRHLEQVAVPRRLCRVGGQGAVGVVIVEEGFKVAAKGHATGGRLKRVWFYCARALPFSRASGASTQLILILLSLKA